MQIAAPAIHQHHAAADNAAVTKDPVVGKGATLHANAAKAKVETAIAKNMESFVADLTATAKTMRTLYDTVLKGIGDKDRQIEEIALPTGHAKRLVDEADVAVVKAIAAVVAANHDIVLIRQKAVK